MPFRPAGPSTIQRLQRLFHSSTLSWADNQNYYEILQVPINATAQEIKKSFYSLSKASHPDHNPNDPDASSRFVRISEAYAVLGAPEKRQHYDRDVMRMSSHVRTIQKGSYHSSGPVGGRPASGLSRRRTQFQGPPPSFYRNREWGNYGAKRHDSAASDAQASGGMDRHGGMGGGMGYGQHPHGWANDVPHFDREGHFRTQTNHERRRQRRRSDSDMPSERSNSMFTNFMLVSGILSVGLFVPSLFLDRTNRGT